MSLKSRLKEASGPAWPVVSLPVRIVRHLVTYQVPLVLHLLDPRRWLFLLRWQREWREGLMPPEGVLTVAVDVAPYWDRLTGVGWYLHQLLLQLAQREGVHLDLFGPTLFRHPEDARPVADLPGGASIRHVVIDVPDRLPLPQGLAVRLLRRREARLVAAMEHEVLFAPNFLLPEKFEQAGGALVVTVHDLGVRRFRWTIEEETLSALEARLEATLARAVAIVTPSEAVLGELVEDGLADAGRVTAVHHGPGHLASAVPGPASARDDRYALFVGTLEPRKNLATLVRAWRGLAASGDPTRLVVCGRWGWKDDELRREVEAAEAEGCLERLGYVEDEELAQLYRGAELLACPSLYEGFGLPILEALSVGCPVVCSDLPVFREVAARAALYVESTDTTAWQVALSGLLADDEAREELRAAGLRRSQEFSWEQAASRTLEVGRQAAARTAR
jgi:alpha-1,3-rhamnosyl/mannosyltransferase